MDVIIKTGFQKIFHKIEFQKQTQPKGTNLAIALHVRDVEEHRHEGVSYLIKANVVRQVSVHENTYAVKLEIDSERMVTAVHCNCVYNRSEKCKHVAAVIYYINNFQSLSKTSFEQQWGLPTARQFVQEKYSKGCDFRVMFPPPKKVHIEPLPIDVSKLKNPSALRNVLLVNPNSQKESQERLEKAAMVLQTQLLKEKESCDKFVRVMLELCEKKNVYQISLGLQEDLKDFYKKSIVLDSRDAIVKLCCDTFNQSDNSKWYAARRLRITASKNAHNIKTRITRTIDSLVQEIIYPKKVDTPAMRYGRTHEKDACDMYEKSYNVCVQKFGLIVSEKQPWLCASPDGAVVRSGIIEKLVEFKCPNSCIKVPIVDYENKRCNVSYLNLNDDSTVELQEKTIYYTQCQIQMYVTGTNVCDLFMWTPVENGSFCVSVKRDEKFLAQVIPKCAEFYFANVLPKLYNKMVLEPKAMYCQPVEKRTIEDNEENKKKRLFTGCNIVNFM